MKYPSIGKIAAPVTHRFHLSVMALTRALLLGMLLFSTQVIAADVIVFDAGTFADHSTYDDGKALAVGMEHVLVNGIPVLLNGKRTLARPGRGLKHASATAQG